MRVHVISDVHGNVDALARAGDGADALIVLGDLIDFVDYHNHAGGILGSVFGPEKVAAFAELRREPGRHAEIVAYITSLWESLTDPSGVVEEAIREQYAKLFAAMTAPTYATPGNVDVPALWPEYAGDHVRVLDGEVAEIGGLRFGFVGGGLRPGPARRRRGGGFRAYLRTEEEITEAAGRLGEIDVLCSHIPPDVPELTYDVLARRPEWGSAGLLELIRAQSPRWSLFGHVHQPLADRMRVGRTECVNVGHFQRAERPYILRW